ncbi:hypothetical protein F511_24293 [Dorcoceras hygrometricum]|uniref:Uncharacterized protein n=1 Tax=Dorcoceras hygrometricum TaxID=472368 RepID=A0A2Z7C774_9LAMI|nr:hypothetical protein F511_24293 [Dorcoceras hygrometricum]
MPSRRGGGRRTRRSVEESRAGSDDDAQVEDVTRQIVRGNSPENLTSNGVFKNILSCTYSRSGASVVVATADPDHASRRGSGRIKTIPGDDQYNKLHQPALEGLTRSARTDSPRQDWPETIFRRREAESAAHGGGGCGGF